MFGIGRSPANWFRLARKRSRKLEWDSARLPLEGEAQSMRETAFREMIGYLEKAIERRPEFADAWFNKGYIHHLMGDRENAIACYRQALRAYPTHQGVLLCLARAHRELDQLQDALGLFTLAVRLDPSDADAWYELAMTMRQADNSDDARRAEARAQALNPSLKPNESGAPIYLPKPRLFAGK